VEGPDVRCHGAGEGRAKSSSAEHAMNTRAFGVRVVHVAQGQGKSKKA